MMITFVRNLQTEFDVSIPMNKDQTLHDQFETKDYQQNCTQYFRNRHGSQDVCVHVCVCVRVCVHACMCACIEKCIVTDLPPYSCCFKDSRVAKLKNHFFWIELAWALQIVGTNATDKVWGSSQHF